MKRKCLALFFAVFMLIQLSFNIAALPDGYVEINISKLVTVPTIDGLFDEKEGWGNPIITITKDTVNNYLSDTAVDAKAIPEWTSIYLRWDDNYLYYCCVVNDAIHYNDKEAATIYDGDGMQFDIKYDTETDTTDRARFFYALTNDGNVIDYQDKVETGVNWEIGENTAMTDCKITRDETNKMTVYESIFSWKNNLPDSGYANVGEGFKFLTRAILLLSFEGGDICDINYPGVTDGNYSYYYATLTGQPADELAITKAAETEAPADSAAAAADTVTTSAQTNDSAPIFILLGIITYAGVMFCKKNKLRR